MQSCKSKPHIGFWHSGLHSPGAFALGHMTDSAHLHWVCYVVSYLLQALVLCTTVVFMPWSRPVVHVLSHVLTHLLFSLPLQKFAFNKIVFICICFMCTIMKDCSTGSNGCSSPFSIVCRTRADGSGRACLAWSPLGSALGLAPLKNIGQPLVTQCFQLLPREE